MGIMGAIDLESSRTGRNAMAVAQKAINVQGTIPLWMSCTITTTLLSMNTGRQTKKGMPKSLLTTAAPEYVLRCTVSPAYC